MPSKVWDEITYPFLNFNGATVEVKEWISNFIPHINNGCTGNYFSMLGLKLNHVSKRGHSCMTYQYSGLLSLTAWAFQATCGNLTDEDFWSTYFLIQCTVRTPYNTNVGVQKIPYRAIWKPVVAKSNNMNPCTCSEPQILVTHDSRQVHMAEQPASRDRLE